MKTQIFLLASTRIEATIEILSLLLVAGIIGYITAWLFYKAACSKNKNKFESERDEFRKQIINLNADKKEMQINFREKDKETEHLILEVNALKKLHTEAILEKDSMTLKQIRTEQLLYEKDEALVHIAQRKHLLDYKSFGTATEAEKDDLKMINGIGPFIEERLHAVDIYTFRQISKFTKRDVETINDAIEYFSGRIERDEWVEQARELSIKQLHQVTN